MQLLTVFSYVKKSNAPLVLELMLDSGDTQSMHQAWRPVIELKMHQVHYVTGIGFSLYIVGCCAQLSKVFCNRCLV